MTKETPLKTVEGGDTYIYPKYLVPPALEVVPNKERLLKEWEESLFEARPDWKDTKKEDTLKHINECRTRYKAFLDKGQDGDIIQRFDGFPFMPLLAGRAGELILRNGAIVAHHITRMS